MLSPKELASFNDDQEVMDCCVTTATLVRCTYEYYCDMIRPLSTRRCWQRLVASRLWNLN